MTQATAQAATDAVVVGGGPAGLAAALWLARYRRSVRVIDSQEPRNRWTELAHGYLGQDNCAPSALLAQARADLQAYPFAKYSYGQARHAQREGEFFVVTTDQERYRARRMVLATGVVDVFPEVDGFFTHYGSSVFHCPSCDGYLAQGRTVVAFGWSVDLAAFALGLLDWADSVAVVADGQLLGEQTVDRRRLSADGVQVIDGVPAELEGPRGGLRAVRLADGRRLPCDLAFFTIAHTPLAGLGEQLGCVLDAQGYVQVDSEQCTSVPGVYAAGDLTPGLQLIQMAAAEGTRAGVSAALSLQGEAPAGNAPPHAPDVADAVQDGPN